MMLVKVEGSHLEYFVNKSKKSGVEKETVIRDTAYSTINILNTFQCRPLKISLYTFVNTAPTTETLEYSVRTVVTTATNVTSAAALNRDLNLITFPL
ncbi:hypothetical protein HXA35_13425 [Bacillus sp. A301a_S52]|jgi:hypothetical protein|nr:hypothetical protein [Bacillus sp. A301a_S52]